MNGGFKIHLEDWLSRDLRADVDEITFSQISIRADGHVLTEVEDLLARTVRDYVRVSAYRLAHWLASNWWRIRWEPENDSVDWQMAHRLGGAGGGYVWPEVRFCSDGEFVAVQSRATRNSPSEQVRYLNNVECLIPGSRLEQGVDDFVEAVIERLATQAAKEDDLSVLWSEIRQERSDAAMSAFRRMEALMGFDPDAAPADLMETVEKAGAELGDDAIEEIAAAFRENAPKEMEAFKEVEQTEPIALLFPNPNDLSDDASEAVSDSPLLPWQRAEKLARRTRQRWGLGTDPLSDEKLSELFSFSPKELESRSPSDREYLHMTAGLRSDGADRVNVYLNRHNGTGRRFALARVVADHLHAKENDRLLPATEAKTARQKFQRAFAQEFLCPFEPLQEFLGPGKASTERMEDAASHFGVSPLLVRTTLVNRGVLERDALAGTGAW